MSWLPLVAAAISAAAPHIGKKSSSWSGKQPTYKKVDTLTSEQKHLLKDITKHGIDFSLPNIKNNPTYQTGTDYLQSLMNQSPEAMKQFEAPYLRQFNEQTVPQLAEQFAGYGALGSSGFQNTLGQAGAGLQELLASLHGKLGLEASNQGLAYSQLPFQQALQGQGLKQGLNMQRQGLALGTPAFGYQGMPGSPGIGQTVGNLAGQFTGGAGGSGILSWLSNLFSGGS